MRPPFEIGKRWLKDLQYIKRMEDEGYIVVNMSEVEYQRYVDNKLAESIIKSDMVICKDFYSFVQRFSPVDYREIDGIPYVSQRVMYKWRILWDSVHDNNIKTLRVFFI